MRSILLAEIKLILVYNSFIVLYFEKKIFIIDEHKFFKLICLKSYEFSVSHIKILNIVW